MIEAKVIMNVLREFLAIIDSRQEQDRINSLVDKIKSSTSDSEKKNLIDILAKKDQIFLPLNLRVSIYHTLILESNENPKWAKRYIKTKDSLDELIEQLNKSFFNLSQKEPHI